MWKAEGLMYGAKHCHGLKCAKCRSLNKVQIQAWMTASVQNIKRLVGLGIDYWLLLWQHLIAGRRSIVYR